MAETYKAILRGDRLEWSGDPPEQTDADQGVEVYVTIARECGIQSKPFSDGTAMSEALAKFAASGFGSPIPDPSAWQREQRQVRRLPDRDA